ncbi:HalOD1 output domain-containing protein [Natronolimnohabitans sp. A-GB9]|uniref:HalOD1 output domain-containing protein n=1 Tax=Natronolimnohabitans sp. A-GB9 TaxID=3069757 RepID=UPI0027B0519C|nr:HalOD1 output domain-containing protein [Natronolimnohabitans sp. A-GB9]MDQ2051818.1 HalOD1 output domain-containing protein [Natronolimnohabitans sp. A-GB9]
MPSPDNPTDPAETGQTTYLATFDPDAGERASEAVITAVADLTGISPIELEPLYDVVDPDALDSLVAHARRADGADTHELQFSYEGYDVDVRTDGQVRVREPSTPASA